MFFSVDKVVRWALFWEKYQAYSIKERDVNINLPDLIENLYNAYIERFGEGKNGVQCITPWRPIVLSISISILVMRLPTGNFVQIYHSVFEHFFGIPYKYNVEKYPY